MNQKKKKNQKSKTVGSDHDPLFNLQTIAYFRHALPDNEDITPEMFRDYAKWQVCKVRNVLFNDPVWDTYTEEEILIEYFTIVFDQNEERSKEFAQRIIKPDESLFDWFEAMEKNIKSQLVTKPSEKTVNLTEVIEPTLPIVEEEFEDKY